MAGTNSSTFLLGTLVKINEIFCEGGGDLPIKKYLFNKVKINIFSFSVIRRMTAGSWRIVWPPTWNMAPLAIGNSFFADFLSYVSRIFLCKFVCTLHSMYTRKSHRKLQTLRYKEL